MAESNSTPLSAQVRRRVIAVLDFDGVPKAARATHLANTCGISRSTAHRFLNGGNITRTRIFVCLYRGLRVDFEWLLQRHFVCFDIRTWRIDFQEIGHYPKDETDRIIRLLVGYRAGHRKSTNLFDLVSSGQMSLLGAARLL